MLGRHRLDPAVAEEHSQLRVAGQSLEDACRVEIGHDFIVRQGRPRSRAASDLPVRARFDMRLGMEGG